MATVAGYVLVVVCGLIDRGCERNDLCIVASTLMENGTSSKKVDMTVENKKGKLIEERFSWWHTGG